MSSLCILSPTSHEVARAPTPPHHADLGPLSLGKLTSLAEIEWVRQLHASCPSLRYYYLGFYIHTCHRMRYKVRYGTAACTEQHSVADALCGWPWHQPGDAHEAKELIALSAGREAAPALPSPSPPQQAPPVRPSATQAPPPHTRSPPFPARRATLRPATCCARWASAGCRWSA
jgi:hypothetical protein